MTKLNFDGSVKEGMKSKSLFGNNAEIGDKTSWVMVEEAKDKWRICWVLEKEIDLVNDKYRLEPIKDSHITRLWKK